MRRAIDFANNVPGKKIAYLSALLVLTFGLLISINISFHFYSLPKKPVPTLTQLHGIQQPNHAMPLAIVGKLGIKLHLLSRTRNALLVLSQFCAQNSQSVRRHVRASACSAKRMVAAAKDSGLRRTGCRSFTFQHACNFFNDVTENTTFSSIGAD